MPVTVAVNVVVPLGLTEMACGDTETAITGVPVTVTVAVPFLEVSAALVAITW